MKHLVHALVVPELAPVGEMAIVDSAGAQLYRTLVLDESSSSVHLPDNLREIRNEYSHLTGAEFGDKLCTVADLLSDYFVVQYVEEVKRRETDEYHWSQAQHEYLPRLLRFATKIMLIHELAQNQIYHSSPERQQAIYSREVSPEYRDLLLFELREAWGLYQQYVETEYAHKTSETIKQWQNPFFPSLRSALQCIGLVEAEETRHKKQVGKLADIRATAVHALRSVRNEFNSLQRALVSEDVLAYEASWRVPAQIFRLTVPCGYRNIWNAILAESATAKNLIESNMTAPSYLDKFGPGLHADATLVRRMLTDLVHSIYPVMSDQRESDVNN